MTARRARCWCGRPVPRRHVPHGVIDCAEHDDRTSAPAPITHVMTKPQVDPSPAAAGDCRTCGGDGFLFHLYEGAVELDGPCPDCTTSRQETAA